MHLRLCNNKTNHLMQLFLLPLTFFLFSLIACTRVIEDTKIITDYKDIGLHASLFYLPFHCRELGW